LNRFEDLEEERQTAEDGHADGEERFLLDFFIGSMARDHQPL